MSGAQRAPEVDLNADLGEGITDDEGLLGVVTSANVACGFHAGDAATMARVCALAVERGVGIGAQVSYADRDNFGRVELVVAADVLRQQVAEQVGLLAELAARAGGRVAYVKPHGALYHRVARDPEQAGAVLAGSGELPVLGMPGTLSLRLASASGRATRTEGFPDRAYAPDGTLVPRTEPGAVLHDTDAVAAHALALAPEVDSLCVHGDHPGAVATARRVRAELVRAGWRLRSPW